MWEAFFIRQIKFLNRIRNILMKGERGQSPWCISVSIVILWAWIWRVLNYPDPKQSETQLLGKTQQQQCSWLVTWNCKHIEIAQTLLEAYPSVFIISSLYDCLWMESLDPFRLSFVLTSTLGTWHHTRPGWLGGLKQGAGTDLASAISLIAWRVAVYEAPTPTQYRNSESDH